MLFIWDCLLSDANALRRNVKYSDDGYNGIQYWSQWGNSLFT